MARQMCRSRHIGLARSYARSAGSSLRCLEMTHFHVSICSGCGEPIISEVKSEAAVLFVEKMLIHRKECMQ